MQIITVAARKGGDGKTTTAHNIGAGLALKGYKVLFVDLDSQANLTRRLDALDADLTAYEALTAATPAQILKTATPINNTISVLPGSLNLANYEKENADKKGAFDCVNNILKPFQGAFDYAIIDTAAAFGLLTVAALAASDRVIIPMRATADSLQGVQALREIIRQVRAGSNKRLDIAGIVPTMYRNRIVNRQLLETMQQSFEAEGIRLFNPIRDCIAVQEAELLQQDIFTYAKRSNAAADYEQLINDLLG